VFTRVSWPERYPRHGFHITYTALGAHRKNEVIDITEPEELLTLNRLRSQCMIALTPKQFEPNKDALFLASIVQKLIQRGSLPQLPQVLETAFEKSPANLEIYGGMRAFISQAIPQTEHSYQLEHEDKLDESMELPFWTKLGETSPDNTRWVTPQASLEALAGVNDKQHRWVDFLYYSPFSETTKRVIEIQGSQHKHAQSVDRDREKLLQKAGLEVLPISDVSGLIGRLQNVADKEGRSERNYSPQLDESLFGPSAMARFVSAIALLLENGDIQPNTILNVDLRSDYPTVMEGGIRVFEFLSSIQRLWKLEALPREVFVNGKSVYKSESKSNAQGIGTSTVKISLEQHVPAHQRLEIPDGPTCIIRGAFLPVDLNFLPPILPNPRLLRTKDSEAPVLLENLLRDIFGHQSFRPNQLEAILAALSGQDSLVLLPTGSGKSLIYQMVGLLQPGITIVVDPIVSLIDDQVRNLNAIGIERSFGIHSAMDMSRDEMDELHKSIAQGQAFFVFISPERLQTSRFRESLASLTATTIVNSAVLDEAHCISEWGHDFRTAYLNVAKNLRNLCRHENFQPTIIALTGTASPSVLRDIEREITAEGSHLVKIQPDSHDRKNLNYVIEVCEAGKSNEILSRVLREDLPKMLGIDASQLFSLDGNKTNSGIVFTTTVSGKYKSAVSTRDFIQSIAKASRTEDVEDEIIYSEPALVEIYSGKTPPNEEKSAWPGIKRERARKFIENEIPTLVATKSFGMGINKPNIRWTLHFGYPSSLEAFAQESGRAGRDEANSYCVLITSPAKSEDARKVLDLQIPTEIRRKDYMSPLFTNTDLATHLFLHSQTYKGRLSEYHRCVAVIRALKDSSSSTSLSEISGGTLDISENILHDAKPSDMSSNEWSTGKHAVESALYRLHAIGIVNDYLVNYGSKSFTVMLGDYNSESIDSALVRTMARIAPGKIDSIEFQVSTAPADLDERVEHHLKLLVETLYDTIEPARIRALVEMQQLASSGLDNLQIKARLDAYLSGGPLATAIEEVAESQHLDISEMTTLLDTVETQDANVWIGAAARQLETYPDNPILLSARVVGEGWRENPDLSIIHSALTSAFSVLDQYQLDSHQAAELLTWISNKFDQQSQEESASKYGALLDAWESNDLPDEPLRDWEATILEKAISQPDWLPQLSRIRDRRMTRSLKTLNTQIDRLKL